MRNRVVQRVVLVALLLGTFVVSGCIVAPYPAYGYYPHYYRYR